MQHNPLGKTNIKVSSICLGTMTWGEQNSEQDAHNQLDMAVDYGVNFVDAAEMYPVPPKTATFELFASTLVDAPPKESEPGVEGVVDGLSSVNFHPLKLLEPPGEETAPD